MVWGDVIVEPDVTMITADIEEPVVVEHQLHYHLNLVDGPFVHEHFSSHRLLHEHLMTKSSHLVYHPSQMHNSE